VLLKRQTEPENGLAEIGFFHGPVGPNRIEEFLLADYAAGILNEVAEHIEDGWS
jgi:hypothetical protein